MSIPKHSPIIKIKAITYRIYIDGQPIVKNTGKAKKVARTLFGLVQAGARGLRTVDISPVWGFRMSQYISDLRKKHGLDIQTIMIKHDEGEHGLYILRTPVEILEIEYV